MPADVSTTDALAKKGLANQAQAEIAASIQSLTSGKWSSATNCTIFNVAVRKEWYVCHRVWRRVVWRLGC